jgi:hypothetical protein
MTGFFERLEDQLHTAAQAHTAGTRWRLQLRSGWIRTGRRIAPTLAVVAVTVGLTVGVAVVAFTIGSHAHHVVSASGRVGGGATVLSGRPDCNAAGINAQQLREGTCLENAETDVVVNKGSTLQLRSLDARYVGFHIDGKFGIATITIKNKLGTPQQWQHTQAALFIPGAGSCAAKHPLYVESLHAETGDQNSCRWKTGTAANGGLQPGESVTCNVVAEIPRGADPTTTGSGLHIANFGDDVSNPSQPVGIIRTYH